MTTARSLASAVSLEFDSVVVGLHLRWDGVYQRPQHLLSRVARRVPVFVVEEPLVDGTDRLETIVDGAVTVFRPHCRVQPDQAVNRRTLAQITTQLTLRRPLVWLYTPMMSALADAFPGSPLVFDAMDELAKFAHSDPRLVELETHVLERASIVFCGGPSLFRSRAGRARMVRLYSSGVDVEFFERARRIDPHSSLSKLPRPIFGYIGVIDERVDLELIAQIADARPDATIVMVGPVTKIEAASVPQRANITYLGKQAYADLPALLAGFDVALMPFALNESTVNISPTKTLEYLAAGRRVVSTAVPDVVSEYSEIVTIAHDRAAFVKALDDWNAPSLQQRAAADKRTHASTWDAIAAAMLDDLDTAGFAPAEPTTA